MMRRSRAFATFSIVRMRGEVTLPARQQERIAPPTPASGGDRLEGQGRAADRLAKVGEKVWVNRGLHRSARGLRAARRGRNGRALAADAGASSAQGRFRRQRPYRRSTPAVN